MARTVNYQNRADKIKKLIDDLVKEMATPSAPVTEKKEKLKLSQIDFDNEDLVTLMHFQARISRIILERSK